MTVDSLAWFTVEMIDQMTNAISEYGHWEQVHSYLVIGEQSAALIDTGLGVDTIKAVIDRLTNLPIKVLTTHVHWDHIGGHGSFKELYVHADDADWLEQGIPQPIEAIRKQFTPENFSRPTPPGFTAEGYTPFTGRGTILHGGELIGLGGRELLVLHTPGHSPGHLCFYESATGYLFTGDLLYAGTLYAFYPSTDPVLYADSIHRLMPLGASKILPAHNSLEIGPELLDLADQAFSDLARRGLLQHGSGVHDFGQLHIKL